MNRKKCTKAHKTKNRDECGPTPMSTISFKRIFATFAYTTKTYSVFLFLIRLSISSFDNSFSVDTFNGRTHHIHNMESIEFDQINLGQVDVAHVGWIIEQIEVRATRVISNSGNALDTYKLQSTHNWDANAANFGLR